MRQPHWRPRSLYYDSLSRRTSRHQPDLAQSLHLTTPNSNPVDESFPRPESNQRYCQRQHQLHLGLVDPADFQELCWHVYPRDLTGYEGTRPPGYHTPPGILNPPRT